MSHPDRITVHAIIPHQDDPELHIVDRQGSYPSRLHERGEGTLEETFRAIGRDTIGRTLSVDTRRFDLEASNTIVYAAKPIDHPLNDHSTYRWMKRNS